MLCVYIYLLPSNLRDAASWISNKNAVAVPTFPTVCLQSYTAGSPSTLVRHLERRYLHNRPLIHLPRPQKIIEYRKQDHRSRHQHTKIHMRRRDGRRHRPKAEEDDDAKYHGPNVDNNAEKAR